MEVPAGPPCLQPCSCPLVLGPWPGRAGSLSYTAGLITRSPRGWKGKHSKTVLLVCQPLPWLAWSPRLGDTQLCRRADRQCVVSGAQGAGLFEQTVRGALSVAQCPRLWDFSVGGKTLRLTGTLPCALLSVWVRPAHLPCSLLPPDCSFELCRTFSRTSTCLPLLDPSSV